MFVTMKLLAKKIIILCIAAVVFLTGVGVTVFNFCCNNCIEHIFVAEKCDVNTTGDIADSHCETVDSHHTGCHDSERIEITNSPDCCTALRYSIDLDSSHFKPVILSPITWLVSFQLDLPSVEDVQAGISNLYRQLKIPLIVSPRDYLSFIQVLII